MRNVRKTLSKKIRSRKAITLETDRKKMGKRAVLVKTARAMTKSTRKRPRLIMSFSRMARALATAKRRNLTSIETVEIGVIRTLS